MDGQKVTDIPSHDLLVGGFPCQAFSVAGYRRGFDDTRGTLFFEIARILDHHRPQCVLLENVKGLLTHDSGQTFQTILKVLANLGYDIEWQVLNTKFFGIPQNRERVFIIGHTRGSGRPKVFPIGEDDARDLEESLYREEANEGRDLTNLKNRRGCAVLTPGRLQKRQNGRRIKEEGEPSFTLTGQDQHGVMCYDDYNSRIRKEDNCGTVRATFNNAAPRNGCKLTDGQRIRRLTPTECERLQGFPDGWTEGISDTQRYKCLGNAVTTKVIAAIGGKLWTQ